jgi:hypothetical protein
LPSRSIAGIDDEGVCVDIAEPDKFLDRADGGRARDVRSSLQQANPWRVAQPLALSVT